MSPREGIPGGQKSIKIHTKNQTKQHEERNYKSGVSTALSGKGQWTRPVMKTEALALGPGTWTFFHERQRTTKGFKQVSDSFKRSHYSCMKDGFKAGTLLTLID